jgi:outer membrane protein assembly factor BamA
LGIGFTFLMDTRNNLLTPVAGRYLNLSASYNISDANYAVITQDFRVYHSFMHNTTFALRFLNQFRLWNIPFYDLSLLGGDQNARGFFYGRYRDRHLSTLQTEFRKILFWRIGVAAFGGVSTVYSGRNAYELGNLKFNLGAGLRFVVDRKENTSLRFDYAIGTGGSSGFYVAFGESF